MDGFLWLAISVGAIILLYFRPPPDKSINLNKQISRRPVIKFTLLPVIKVIDKGTQTEENNKSPMSQCLSLDFPFDFDEEYLNRNHSLQYNSPSSSCEKNQISGSIELWETPGTMIVDKIVIFPPISNTSTPKHYSFSSKINKTNVTTVSVRWTGLNEGGVRTGWPSNVKIMIYRIISQTVSASAVKAVILNDTSEIMGCFFAISQNGRKPH